MTFLKIRAMTPASGPHASSGFSRIDTSAQVITPTVRAGNQKIASKYTAPIRLRTAHRIIFLLAFVTLLASMFSGQKIMLDILAIIFFIAAIITSPALRGGVSKP